jgi:hypothetical protein
MKNYLLQTPSIPESLPLFQFESGAPLTHAISTQFASGLDETLYASHSFRIGAATAAGSAGLPTWLIKTLGRWSSDCYERYIRTPRDVLVSVTSKLIANTNQKV